MAVTIPAERYTSSAFAALEDERLWPRVWQLACSLDHVANPGDFHELRVGVTLGARSCGATTASCARSRTRAGTVGARCARAPAPASPRSAARSTAGRTTWRAGCARCRRGGSSASLDPDDGDCRPRSGAGRHLGPARLREPRARRRAARRVPRRGARRLRVGPRSTSSAAPPRCRSRRRATGRR